MEDNKELITSQSEHEKTSEEKPAIKNSATFAEQVDAVLSGADMESSHLELLKVTPPLLRMVGVPNLPILMTARHVKTITQESGSDSANYHGLGTEIIKKLPELISDPVMIMDSLTQNDSIVIVTQTVDKQYRPVIGAIKLDGIGRQKSEMISANILTSAYGRNNFQSFIARNIEQGTVLYADKEKSQALSVNPGIQFPDVMASLSFNTIIRKTKAFVKSKEEKIKENKPSEKEENTEKKEEKMKLSDRIKRFFGRTKSEYKDVAPQILSNEEFAAQRERIGKAREKAMLIASESGQPYVTIMESDSVKFKPGDVLSLVEAEKSFTEENKEVKALDAGDYKTLFTIDSVYKGKMNSADCVYRIGAENGGIAEQLAETANSNHDVNLLNYSKYLQKHLELEGMVDKAIAAKLPLQKQYDVQGYALFVGNDLNASQNPESFEFPPLEIEHKEKIINTENLPHRAFADGPIPQSEQTSSNSAERRATDFHDKVFGVREEMVKSLIRYIEQSPKQWEAGWNNIAGTAPENGKTGTPYRGLNLLYLTFTAMQKGYTDPRWVTFNQAKELGASVKKGEKSSPIIFYELYDRNTKKSYDSNTTKNMTDEQKDAYMKENVYAVLKYSNVFNASQCHNFPERDTASMQMKEEERAKQNALIESIISNSAAPVLHDGGNEAFYSPMQDKIHLPPLEAFNTMQDYYATALHEIAHSTGHESRLNRDLSGSRHSSAYAKEELRAELACVFMQVEQGLKLDGKHFSNHAAYLNSWLNQVKDDPQIFYAAARDAEKISDYVAENYLHAAQTAELEGEAVHSNTAAVVQGNTEKKEALNASKINLTEKRLKDYADILRRNDLEVGNTAQSDEYYINQAREQIKAYEQTDEYRGAVRADYPRDFEDELTETLLDEAEAHVGTLNGEHKEEKSFEDTVQELATSEGYSFTENAELVHQYSKNIFETELKARDVFSDNNMQKQPAFSKFSTAQIEHIAKNYMYYNNTYAFNLAKIMKAEREKYEYQALKAILQQGNDAPEYIRIDGYNYLFRTEDLTQKYGGKIENGQIVVTPELENSFFKLNEKYNEQQGEHKEKMNSVPHYTIDFKLNCSNEMLLSNELKQLGFKVDRDAYNRNEQRDGTALENRIDRWVDEINYVGAEGKSIEGWYGKTFNGIMLESTDITGFTTSGLSLKEVQAVADAVQSFGVNVTVKEIPSQHRIVPEQKQETSNNGAAAKAPLVVNLFAGPGAGKTTAALELTAALKKEGYNVEYVSEFAKELVLEGRTEELKDQEFVTNEQYHRIDRLRNSGVEIIVTDSPVLLGKVYGEGKNSAEYDKQILDYHNSFENFNLMVKRGETFQAEGRVHNLEQSKELDTKITSMLRSNQIFYGNYHHGDIDKTIDRINATYARLYGEKQADNKNVSVNTFCTDFGGEYLYFRVNDGLSIEDVCKGYAEDPEDGFGYNFGQEISESQYNEIRNTSKGFNIDFLDDINAFTITQDGNVLESGYLYEDLVLKYQEPEAQEESAEKTVGEELTNKTTWSKINLPDGAVGNEYGKTTLVKMPQSGEYAHFGVFVSTQYLRQNSKTGKWQLNVGDKFTYRLTNDGRQVELTGQELKDSFAGVLIGKTPERVAPSRKNLRVLDNLEKNVPKELRVHANWCVYRTYKETDKEKKGKVIKSAVTGEGASPKNSADWTDFDTAMKYARENNFEGLAFVLEQNSGITCIDLDKCIKNAETGEMKERATKLIEELKGTYMERSTSGNGVHIFIKDDILKGGKYKDSSVSEEKGDLEVFDNQRIISMTGDMFSETNTLTRAGSSATVYLRQELGEKQQTHRSPSSNVRTGYKAGSDREVVERIRRSKRAGDFEDLYTGHGITGNASIDDMKLANILAFFTNGDAAQCMRIMREASTYRSDKPESYYNHTISKAIDTLTIRPSYGAAQGASASNKRTAGNGAAQ
ncbi:MAG: ssDNA-binding domain-containing protein [Clostridia bacterium]|nr:ssDNA-binding domain-containing protein [Clostridia bacterium]